MDLKRICFLLLCLFALSSAAFAGEKGPFADRIYFDVRMQTDIGIQDVAAGKSDIFYYGAEGPAIHGLDRATLDKLEIYSIPSGSWSLLINPIPNEAPYTVTVDGKEYFNPLAIREVRFALNYLINRQYIVDEILGGAGGPMMTMATPGQPGTYRYNLVASKMGLTPEGDEERALREIKAALTEAAKLPALKGKLKEGKDWWTFNGEPVTVKFAIRVDDPEGRAKEGEYVAQQIEKAKIKVERLMWDRSKSNDAVYGGNPADYEWHIYTEGWSAGATRAWWEHIVAQMYAPWYGYMPGGAYPENWNYTNPEIDRLTEKAYSGSCLTEEEYWETALEALRLGLEDAVRIYVCYQNQYFVANKAAFNGRFAYGLGDGLTNWSLITANTKDKEVRATQYSAQGALFMSNWDPVGADGFNDTY
ncbi:MAG TPA: ABC transporter substrate-binding protein, partial [Capillibacterium sp.]